MTELGLGLQFTKKILQVKLNLLIPTVEGQTQPQVWASEGNRRGLNVTPIKTQLKIPGEVVQRKQYPLPLQGRMGLKPIIEGLLQEGLLEPCMSSYNTPILPVHKVDGSYCLVQDLRAINQIVKHPVVPNPYTLLSKIPFDHQWFSVIDLKDAFWA